MQKNLVIVESPAKAKTIEGFLGSEYKVMSSFGHIRDLQKKGLGIDIDDSFQPLYEIASDKEKLVNDLKKAAKSAETIWLASDEDREGEAIAWHLYKVLDLKESNTKRIVFHEITKNAITEAIQSPRSIDENLVNAQQARRVLDRLVGFEVSPILWKRIKPALSAGRVQSVAVRLIVEREREILNFESESFYRLQLTFSLSGADGQNIELKADYPERLNTKEEALALMEKLKNASFKIASVSTKPGKKSPAAPFTTSTLQQEAARKLGFSISQTMRVAQSLYESGKITYMRTDSVHLSKLALATAKAAIEEIHGAEYCKTRQYQTKSKGAQEAHEAIRPAYMNQSQIEGSSAEKRLYELIWKRTLASQMADAKVEKTTISISYSGGEELFIANGEVVTFDGFLRVYDNPDNHQEEADSSVILPKVKKGQELQFNKAAATQRFTQKPARYNEASLVHKLEELGIGRPSTYAPTISTIQQREYIVRGNRDGEKREYNLLEMNKKFTINEKVKTETTGAEKSKLFPTDIGIVVNDFLMEHFANIMDYHFTASIEKQFDEVAEGKVEWRKMMNKFYKAFHPCVDLANTYSKEKVGARLLGTDPKSGRPVSVRIGRFGPIAQIGTAEDEEKPLFASLKKNQLMETLSLEEALDLFKLPRQLGDFEEKTVVVGTGRFGHYIRHNNKFVSLPKDKDPLEISLEEAIALIQENRAADAKKLIKTFSEDADMQVLNGRFGPYICKAGNNYKIAKSVDAASLSYEDCLGIIESQTSSNDKKKVSAKSTGKTASKTTGKTASKSAGKTAAGKTAAKTSTKSTAKTSTKKAAAKTTTKKTTTKKTTAKKATAKKTTSKKA